MKVRLEHDAACEYYEKKGFSVYEYEYGRKDDSKKRKSYSISLDIGWRGTSYGKYQSNLGLFERLVLTIPAEVDLAPGGGFIDPLRMMPINPEHETDATILRPGELNAIMAWATVGVLEFETTFRGGREVRIPIFRLGEKVGKSKYLLVWTRWDRTIDWGKTGITKTDLLAVLTSRGYLETKGQKEAVASNGDPISYFERITDDYGMSGMDIFVISVPDQANHWCVRRWLEWYRAQKWSLIRAGEKYWRMFRRNSAKYMREIMAVLSDSKKQSNDISKIDVVSERFAGHKAVWKAVKVVCATSYMDVYTCDQVGLARVRQKYGMCV